MPDQNINCGTCKHSQLEWSSRICTYCYTKHRLWEPKDHIEKMADNHWKWVEGLLNAAHIEFDDLHVYLFKTALEHGVKHGKED